jgi:hypothetical protein
MESEVERWQELRRRTDQVITRVEDHLSCTLGILEELLSLRHELRSDILARRGINDSDFHQDKA